MNALLYGIGLQFKIDIRSKSLLITCYLLPLLFFAFMGGIFTSLMPEAKDTLIQSMTVFGISMGTLVGVPVSLVEIYGTDIKKMYTANGAPLYFGLFCLVVSAFLHLMIMSGSIFVIAPIVFDARVPSDLPLYFGALSLFILVSLSVGCVLGLLVKNQAKVTMFSQIIFLPSMMLSGIMFSTKLLPAFLENLGKVLPATWGYRLLSQPRNGFREFMPLLLILFTSSVICSLLLKKQRSE